MMNSMAQSLFGFLRRFLPYRPPLKRALIFYELSFFIYIEM